MANNNCKRLKHNVQRLVIFIFSLLLIPSSEALAEYEKQGTLNASSFLSKELLKGKYHSVEEKVHTDGLYNHYRVESPFGTWKITSTISLKILVNELHAIAEMKKVETDDTAIESLKQSGENTVTGVKNLFNDPQGSLEGAASGVSSLFNRASQTIGKRQATDAEDGSFEQLIGYSKAKGEIATRFGVNVYSRNQVLGEELSRLAKANYLGGLGVGVATSFVPGVGGLVLTTSGTTRLLNEAINTTPAPQLWLDNKNKLLKIGVNQDTVELFLNNPVFSPAMQTVMVAALESMKTVQNRALYIKIALQANTYDMAKLITETTVLTAGYNKNIAPLKTVTPLARLACGVKKNGDLVLTLPTDYIIWSERVANTANIIAEKLAQSKGSEVEIWTLGDMSTKARSEIEKQGWKIHTRVGPKLIPKS